MSHNDLSIIELETYLTHPQEKLILSKRQSWLIMLASIIPAVVFLLLALTAFLLLIEVFLKSFLLEASISLVIYSFILSFVVTQAVSWYYHFYIVTDRKILEVTALPLLSTSVNEVLLDQVRTTEVNTHVHSVVGDILNIGDIAISFDRPSHDTHFEIKNIFNPREEGIYLANELEDVMSPVSVWFKKKKAPEHIKFTEDIFPKEAIRQ